MSKFDHVIQNGYNFELSEYLSEGWELFKKGAGNLIGFTLLYFVIMMALAFIPLVNLLSNVIQYVLLAGFYIYCRKLVNDKAEFNDFFGGFQHFVQIFLHLLVFFLFMLPVFFVLFGVLLPYELIPEILSGDIDSLEYFFEEWLASLAGNLGTIIFVYIGIMIVVLYLYLSYTFTLPLIVNDGLQFWDAMETSRKVVGQKILSFLVLFIVLTLIVTIGSVITCGLGILAAIPFIYCVVFVAYDRIFFPDGGESTEAEAVSTTE